MPSSFKSDSLVVLKLDSNAGEIRVRYAPSPTGSLHLGGLRTALFNYLFAKASGGKFILRIEDTDKKRQVEGSIEALTNSLRWCGLKEDEGPNAGGEYGPYIQSERTEIYRKYADQLVENGHAYHCFCSSERLEALRDAQHRRGLPTMYDRACLGLVPSDIQQKIENGESYTIRLKVTPGRTTVKDLVRGYVQFCHKTVDDQVLLKSDGFPTYHLANVVDDHLMKISHVIRGEEWLASTPKHLMLYKALGFETPQFAHLGLLLNENRSKLSKRQGDVSVEDFQAKNFMNSALVNFVALLGWNPSEGDTKEVYTLKELESEFKLENINKAGSIVNVERLLWLNSRHIRMKIDESKDSVEKKAEIVHEFKAELMNGLSETGRVNFERKLDEDVEFLWRVIDLMKERVTKKDDFEDLCNYFFEEPDYESEMAKALKSKAWNDKTDDILNHLLSQFEALSSEEFLQAKIKNCFKSTKKEFKIGMKDMFLPLRYILTGMDSGAGIADNIELLGKEKTVQRMKVFV